MTGPEIEYTDAEIENRLNSTLGIELSETEILGRGVERPRFSKNRVIEVAKRIDESGVLPMLQKWRAEDRYGKRAGGRPAYINDRAILTAVMLLRGEGRPIMISELRDLFRFRLNYHGRLELGIHKVTGGDIHEHIDLGWYHRARRSLIRILVLMDAWPGKRTNHTRQQRDERISLRDRNFMRLRQERAAEFSSAMLLMPLKLLPDDLAAMYLTVPLSVDQTSLRAFGQRGPRQRDKKTSKEMAKYREDGSEIERLVLEPDAGWYPVMVSSKSREDAANTATRVELEYDFSLTLIDAIPSAEISGVKLPSVVVGASMNTPNMEIAEETLRPINALLKHGFTPQHLTGDLGYSQLGADNYQSKMRDLGVPILMNYKKTQLGIKGGVGGSLQVEGDHYCPSTPKGLIQASVDFEARTIDSKTWNERIKSRGSYRLRRKEKPDERGHYPMICPAYGPQATVTCPLRDVHAKSSKKVKPDIKSKDLPEAPNHVCTQTSVDFSPEDGVEHKQAIRFGTPKWQAQYRADRQTIESKNNFIKSGSEALDNPKNRRIRGLAAQGFIALTATVQSNIRRIAIFLNDLRRSAPKQAYARIRDVSKTNIYIDPVARKEEREAPLVLPQPPPGT